MKIDFDLLDGFDWDKSNIEHIEKHNVDYIECEEVFANQPLIVFFDEKHSIEERRYKIFGISSKGRKLTLAITIRHLKIRIITARDRNKKERREYKNL